MALYKAYPAPSRFRRRGRGRCAAGNAVLERSRPLLQLAASGMGENQRTAGMDGAGGKSRA